MNIILITTEGYPEKFSANNSKSEFIAMGLIKNDCNVTIVDTLLGTKGNKEIKAGVYKNINYHIFPRKNKIISIIKNAILLSKILSKNKQKKDNYAIIGMNFYPAYIITAILCRLHGYKRTALFQEWHISLNNLGVLAKFEAWIKDKTFGYFLNGIFPISHFLFNKARHFNKPQMFVPVMASYDRVIHKYSSEEIYNFTYCGHSDYLLRNDIILKAFENVSNIYNKSQLTLVLSGNEKQMHKIKQLTKDFKTINIKYQISQEELFNIYDNSLALLIPLNPNSIQDQARFSQKIAEYVGSKRPIITNNVGEIPYYFNNNKSAIIVDYTSNAYSEAMIKLINNPSKAKCIGEEGYKVGVNSFDYINVSKEIKDFLSSI